MQNENIRKYTQFGLSVILFFILNVTLSIGMNILQGIIQG